MNECINSGMSKTAWCRANGISEKQFFYWQRILRREAFENSRNSSLPATVGPDQELMPATQRTVSFTEIKLPSSSQSTAPGFHPDLVIRKGSLILEISNSASDELLSWIGGSWVLNNATGFRKIYIAAGYTDLRRGIDGLASIIKFNFQLDPYERISFSLLRQTK